MTERHRNQFLGKLWDACPHCYKHAYRHKIRPNGLRYYYCSCGTVWHWRKGSLRSPVCDTVAIAKKAKPKVNGSFSLLEKVMLLLSSSHFPGLFKPSLLQVASFLKPMDHIVAEGFKHRRLEQGTADTPTSKPPTWWSRLWGWLWKRTKHPCGHF